MTYFEEFPRTPDFSYPDFSAINAAYRQAEDQGIVSPNHLPVGRMLGNTQLDAAFACMSRIVDEEATVPAEPPPVRGATKFFDDRTCIPRDDLDTTSPLAGLSETAGPEDSTSATEVTDVEIIVRPSKLLRVFRRAHPHAHGAKKPSRADIIVAKKRQKRDSIKRKTNGKTDWD